MTFDQFLSKVDEAYYEHEFEMRHGQAIMNTLREVWPEKYKEITISDSGLDCFYDDGIVQYTLDYLKENWNE